MADIVYLDQDDLRPETDEKDPWLFIEQQNGKYFGSGGAWKNSGEWVGYGSLKEDDVSLDLALQAAQKWADRFNVKTIFVFLEK
jgi:hypothetical protein